MHTHYFSRLGFILAVAGSAIGLGNIWKFPYMTGTMGGGAFVLVYLFTVLIVGISLLVAEMLIGNLTSKDTVSAFEELAPKNSKKIWKLGGFMAFSGLLILTFYSVVIGWIFYYLFLAFGNSFYSDIKASENLFVGFLGNDIWTQLFAHLLAVIVTFSIVYKGVKQGIEKINLILMPLLIVIFLLLLGYSISLPSFGKAFHFLFDYDFSKINSETLLMAVGHSFFTLSIGMGAIMTYSASASKKTKIFRDAIIIALLDTTIALVAGLTIFSFLFNAIDEPAKGPGLLFIALPAIFAQMDFVGQFISILFFIAVSFAAITSAISIAEPSISITTNRYKISRLKAVVIFAIIVYLVGALALLSNATEFSNALTFGSKNLFDWLDYFTTAILLPVGGIIIAIFVGYIIPKNVTRKALDNSMNDTIFKFWLFSVRYIAPIGVAIVLLNESGLLG